MRLFKPHCFLVFFFFSWFSAFGQQDTLPYDQWISKLSLKQDNRAENYRMILSALGALDSTKFCSAFSVLKSKANSNNPRLKIRLLLLENRFSVKFAKANCLSGKTSLVLLNEALAIAYELEDELLLFQIFSGLVGDYSSSAKYGQAVLYGWMAKDVYDKWGKGKIFPMSTNLYSLAFSLYHTREYRSSIDVSLLFLHPGKGYLSKEDTMDNVYYMWAWNTLGLSYAKMGIADSAFVAFDHALDIARENNRTFWVSIITGNKGDVYFQQGKYDSAEVKLKFDYAGSMAAKEYDNAANSLQWLARIDLVHQKPNDALEKAREAQTLLHRSYHPDYMVNTLLTFTKVFASLGKADSLNHYLEKFLVLHDSIEQKASDSRAENVQMAMQSQENIHTIQSLNKEKKRIALIRNFILVFIILLAFVGFMILNRQKLKLKVRRQEALEEKRKAEQEAILAKEQLKLYTRNLIEKTSLVETLQTQLMEREMSEEQKLHISELSQHAILTDEDWDNFKPLFEKVYPGFFYSLRQKVVDLTMADQRMAAICKLQLSNKEAATILGIAPNSVIKAKQRLRHRLGLEPEADLELYFAQSKDFN